MGCLNMMIGVTEEALADRAENYRKLALKDGFSKTKFIMWQVPPNKGWKITPQEFTYFYVKMQKSAFGLLSGIFFGVKIRYMVLN